MDSRLRVPTLIYDFFAEITRPKDGDGAIVKSIYPRDYEMTEETRKQIPKFVWPMRTENDKEEHFTFVLTDLDSKYKFGFCRYPPKGETCTLFLSALPWYKVFYRALDKVADLMLNHQIEVVEPFLKGLYSHPLPKPGVDTILSVVPSEVDAGQVYAFPLPNPKKLAEIPTDDNLTQFYTNLHYNVILHLFANMIFERRIIITSSSLSVLSAAVHGAVLLLYPLHWQHIFIPITPPHLLDYCGAPMPFLMGVHSSYMDIVRRNPTDEIVILDVDESTIESAHVEDLTTLPADVVSTLKHVLKKQSSAYGDTVTRSFLLAQVAMIGGYRSALKFRQGEKEVIFDEDQFLKSRPNMEDFLGQLLHFQHFRQFINSKIDKLKNRKIERDLFDNEVLAYEEELKGSEQVKAVFDKFISSTVEGSKKFAELSGKLGGNIKKQVKQARVVMKKNLKHKPQPYPNRNYYDQHSNQLQFNNPSLIRDSRTRSLPSSQRSLVSLPSQGTTTPPPNLGQIKMLRKPPPVIPYHRHIEGKKKLVESLKQQSAPDMSQGIFFTITPPDTPSKLDQDHAEKVSLNSISYVTADDVTADDVTADVVVGNLIDISSEPGHSVENTHSTALDTISSASVSTASLSSSDEQTSSPPLADQQVWEKFDDFDDELAGPSSSLDRPPLPPPRSELEKLYNTPVQPGTDQSCTVELTIGSSGVKTSTNPFEGPDAAPPRPKSPFEDFSSSIAEALISNSEQKKTEDPTSATALATTGKELFDNIQEEKDDKTILKSLDSKVSSTITPFLQPDVTTASVSIISAPSQSSLPSTSVHGSTGPLINPASSGSATSEVSTAQLRTNQQPMSLSARHRSNSFSRQQNALRPIPQEGTFSADSIASNTNPFYCGSVNAGNYPQLTPLSQKPCGPRSPSYVQNFPLPSSNKACTVNSQRRSGLPPPKPQPYTGECQWSQQEDQGNISSRGNDVMLRGRQTSVVQRLPSLGNFDPFGDFLSTEGGMAGYVFENSNTSPS